MAKKKKADIDAEAVEVEFIDTKATVAKHPRARRSIRTTKAWAALLAFIIVEYRCLKGGMTFDQSVVRALLAGIGAYLLAWIVAVIVWRQLVVAEIEAFRRRLIAAAEEAEAAAAEEQQTPSFS